MTAPGYSVDNARIGHCPNAETLTQFFQLELTPEQRPVVRLHVDRCPSCQSQLDQLASSGIQLSNRQPTLNRMLDERFEGLVDSLCHAIRIEPVESPPVQPPIQLEPTADGQYLGQLNQYTICRELARGGSGTVFAAIDTQTNTPVAIKYIRSTDPQVLRRVEREARAISQVQHPNVISILSIETSVDGRLFLVMPLASGHSLAELIQSPQDLPFEKSVSIVMQVASGLTAVHNQGLIHRDIKPSNIMVNADGEACLTDFGLAAFVDEESSLTGTDVLVGTPSYMSPEQARNQPSLDVRSDLYSLGVTLYECLTGARLFRGPAHQVLQQIQHSEPPRPRLINAQIPPALEAICLKAIQKNPELRYQTVAAFRDDLQAWRTGKPVLARLPSWWEQIRKWIRRDPRLATAIAGIVVTIGIGVAAAWHYSAQANEQSRLAQSRFDASLQTINLLAELSTQTLSGDPALASIRQQIQTMADKAFEPLIELRPSNPENLLRYLKAMDSLGGIKHTVVGPKEALVFRQKLVEENRAALTGSGVSADLRRLWVSLNHRLAVGHVELRDYAEAAKALDEAEAHVDSADALDHLLLASLEHSRGTLAYWTNNDIVTASAHFRQSIAYAESYLQHSPADRRALATKSNTRGWLADCELQLGNGPLAEQMLRELWNDHALLAAPPNGTYQNRLDKNRAALSLLNVLVVRGEGERALQWSLEQHQEIENFAAANPTLMEPAALLVGFGCDRVGAELLQGHFDDAQQQSQRLLTLAQELDRRFPQTTRVWQVLGHAKQMWMMSYLNKADYQELVPFIDAWLEQIKRDIAQGLNVGFNQQLEFSLKTNLAALLDAIGDHQRARTVWSQVLAESPVAVRPGMQLMSQLADLRASLGSQTSYDFKLDQGFEESMTVLETTLATGSRHPSLAHACAEYHAMAWHYWQANQGSTAAGQEKSASHLKLAQQYLQSGNATGFYRQADRLEKFRQDPLFAGDEFQRCVDD